MDDAHLANLVIKISLLIVSDSAFIVSVFLLSVGSTHCWHEDSHHMLID